MPLTPTYQDPPSPCVRNCCLDDDDICMGCGRSLKEITQWSASTSEQKEKILILSGERKRSIQLRRQR